MKAMKLSRGVSVVFVALLLLVSLSSTCAAGNGGGKGDNGGAFALLFGLIALAAIAPVTLLMAAVSPLFVKRAGAAMSAFKLHTVLWGIAASLLALVLVAILANVGPGGQVLAVLLALAWFGLAATGFSGFAAGAGERMLARDGMGLPARPIVSTFTGLVVCGWVFVIPIVGGLLALAATVVGTGAALQALFKAARMDESMSDADAPPPGARPQITSFAPPTIVSEPEPPAAAAVASPAQVQAAPPPPPPAPAPERQDAVLDVNLDDEAEGQPTQEGQGQ